MAIRRFHTLFLLTPALLAAACSDGASQDESDLTEGHKVRITEVLGSSPLGTSGAFVELRNDADADVSLKGWTLKVGSVQARLTARPIKGSVGDSRGEDPYVLQGHELALIVDA